MTVACWSSQARYGLEMLAPNLTLGSIKSGDRTDAGRRRELRTHDGQPDSRKLPFKLVLENL